MSRRNWYKKSYLRRKDCRRLDIESSGSVFKKKGSLSVYKKPDNMMFSQIITRDGHSEKLSQEEIFRRRYGSLFKTGERNEEKASKSVKWDPVLPTINEYDQKSQSASEKNTSDKSTDTDDLLDFVNLEHFDAPFSTSYDSNLDLFENQTFAFDYGREDLNPSPFFYTSLNLDERDVNHRFNLDDRLNLEERVRNFGDKEEFLKAFEQNADNNFWFKNQN